MIKNNMHIKDSLNIYEKIGMINLIVDSYFTDGNYTPYFADQAITTSIVTYMIEGIEFDDNDESIYETVISDSEICKLIDDCKETDICKFVLCNVKDIVEVKKQKYIHNESEIQDVLSYVEVFAKAFTNFANLNINSLSKEEIDLSLEFMKNMKDSKITEENITNALNRVVKNHKMPNTKIYKEQREYISEQRNIIEQQNKELTELRKWKREHTQNKDKE